MESKKTQNQSPIIHPRLDAFMTDNFPEIAVFPQIDNEIIQFSSIDTVPDFHFIQFRSASIKPFKNHEQHIPISITFEFKRPKGSVFQSSLKSPIQRIELLVLNVGKNIQAAKRVFVVEEIKNALQALLSIDNFVVCLLVFGQVDHRNRNPHKKRFDQLGCLTPIPNILPLPRGVENQTTPIEPPLQIGQAPIIFLKMNLLVLRRIQVSLVRTLEIGVKVSLRVGLRNPHRGGRGVVLRRFSHLGNLQYCTPPAQTAHSPSPRSST